MGWSGDSRGMTLLEVVLSLMLFSMVALSLMRMTNNTLRYRRTIDRSLDDTRGRAAYLTLLRRDLRNAFLVEDLNARGQVRFATSGEKDVRGSGDRGEASPSGKKSEKKGALEQQPSPQGERSSSSTGLVEDLMHRQVVWTGGFVGTGGTLLFRTRSYIRSEGERGASDQQVVFYYLRSCKALDRELIRFPSCLWRKFSHNLSEELTAQSRAGEREFVVLEDVTSLEFSYFNLAEQRWVGKWDTGSEFQQGLPVAVRVRLEFRSRNRQTVRQEWQWTLYQSQIPVKWRRAG